MRIEELYEVYLKSGKVSTDTRTLPKGAIYFALKGANFNGNAYAQKALNDGASLAVVDEDAYAKDPRIILVQNALECLQQLARHHRRQWKFPVFALTGSNGKTTHKELIQSVLSTTLRTYATKGNLNNHIGVPLTLLSIPSDADLAIVEMGANHQGEIAGLCQIAEPNMGLITNIGKAHLEGFGGPEGVKKGKKELFDFLLGQKSPILFVNADDPVLMEISKAAPKRILYGSRENCLVRGKLISSSPFVIFSWQTNNYTSPPIETNLVGSYNLYNFLAAVTVGIHFGCDPGKINQALVNYTPSNQRSQWIETDNNKVIMDAYNANPSSMEVAINNFATLKDRPKGLILGDMLELGSEESAEHEKILQLLRKYELKAWLVGPVFHKIAGSEFPTFKDSGALKDFFRQHPPKGFTLLVKGSRGIALEKLLETL